MYAKCDEVSFQNAQFQKLCLVTREACTYLKSAFIKKVLVKRQLFLFNWLIPHHSILPTRLDDLFRFWFVSFFEPAPLTCPCKFAADAAAAADAVFGKLGERPLEDAAVDPPGLRLILTP